MNLLQTLPVATRALMRNKTRSFLTTLGVVIGVASVICGSDSCSCSFRIEGESRIVYLPIN